MPHVLLNENGFTCLIVDVDVDKDPDRDIDSLAKIVVFFFNIILK